MVHKNSVSMLVYGRQALFSDPMTRIGGEKCSYPIPTYQALKGILESVYWKPTFIWIVDAMRVLKPIRTQSKGVRPIQYDGGNTLSIYTYLTDVAYEVKAHFIWNQNRPELEQDRNEHKHYQIARRMIEKGGRRDIFLGTRECQGYVEPCRFGEGESAYERQGDLAFGLMFHSFGYADETGNEIMTSRFWNPKMRDGLVEFCPPEDCPVERVIREQRAKAFVPGKNFALSHSSDRGGEAP